MINQEENKIEFLSAEAKSEDSVLATYKLSGSEFSVEWSNILHDGEIDDTFHLCDGHGSVISDDVDLNIFIEEEISKEEASDIYLFVRDTFDASDAKELALELVEPKAVAKTITSINNIEEGWTYGFGEYSAKVSAFGAPFQVDNLVYEYGINDDGSSYGVNTNNETTSENLTTLFKAAEKAGKDINEEQAMDILGQLESHIENEVEVYYGLHEVYIPISSLEGQQMFSIILCESPKGGYLADEINRIAKEAEVAAEAIRDERNPDRHLPEVDPYESSGMSM